MIIFLQTIDVNHQLRSFSVYLSQLELAFDVLDGIQSTGDRLIAAELIDKGQRTQLPVHAFDGENTPFSTEIQQLEREWQQLLNVAINE